MVVTLNREELAPFLMSRIAKDEAAEEVAWKITGIVVEAIEKLWTWSREIGAVVPRPMPVPLSKKRELAVEEAPVYLTKKLEVPAPDNLLLKVNQSLAWSWPVLTLLAKGRLRVKVLEEILPLKIAPAVPVARVVTTLVPKEILVEVPIKTLCPPVMERLEPTVREPKVVVPRPPLAGRRTPETLLPPKAIALAVICCPDRDR